MQRVGVLNGNNITYDHDLAGLVRGLTEGGVIEGGTISGSKVQPVQAVVAAKRSNGQKLMLYFESDEQVSIPSSGTFKVYIEVDQSKIDDGTNNAENGTGIASIKTGPTLPSQNSLLLASVSEGVVKDERNLIPKVQQIAQRTGSLESTVAQATADIADLKEAGAVDHLEESGIVGERYTLENQLFKQYTPKAEDSTIAINVGDIDKNKEIHIQRIGSGTASNQLKLKLKKFGAPTTSVVVEVRKGVKVDVSNKEAYRYGGEVVATATLAYTDFLTDWGEKTITLNNQFGGMKGELLDIVVYQQGGIVNSTNYYQIACDSTQYSEAFSYVSVNGTSRVREKLMPYCVSDGFAQGLLVKATGDFLVITGAEVFRHREGLLYHQHSSGGGDVMIKAIKCSGTKIKIRANVLSPGTYFSASFRFKDKNTGQSIATINGGDIGIKEVVGTKQKDSDIEIWSVRNREAAVKFERIEFLEVDPPAPKTGFQLYPRALREIGETIPNTIIGRHINNGRIIRDGETATTAQTGSVVLGNAVGYKTDYLSDGTEVLVPYYKKG